MPFGFFKEIHITDPGFGTGGGDIDNTLPGGGGHPWLPGYGRPDRPDQGLPGYGRPDNGLPSAPVRPDGSPILPARPWPPVPFPPRPFPPGLTDPDWGIEGGPPTHPGQPIYLPPVPGQGLPGLPTLPGRPDQGLPGGPPPVPGGGPIVPPTDPPPGTIWPPIAGLPEGKCALVAWFYRLGWRYVVVEGHPSGGPIIPPPTGGGTPPTGGAPAPTTEAGYLTKALGATTMDSTVSLFNPSTTAVIGTVLQVDSEYMTVSSVADPQNLQVARATYGSTIAEHAVNAIVSFLKDKPAGA